MATYGLQTEFLNTVMAEYFGIKDPVLTQNEIYVGLGLEQNGAQANTDDFTEVFGGKPLGNYRRARVIFGYAEEGMASNRNDIVFQTASEDWTTDLNKISMLGLFNTHDTETETGEKIKPWVVLRLPKSETVRSGETIILTQESVRLALSDL